MAMELLKDEFPGLAASAINDRAAVRQGASGTERAFLPIASLNLEPFGIAGATGASPADALPVHYTGVIKVTAIASLGAGADIGVASTNGGLAPVAGASGSVVWAAGKSLGPAAAGEVFSLFIRPRQLSGTP